MRSTAQARLSVLRRISLDMRFNLNVAWSADEAGRRADLVQMAFLDYGFLLNTVRQVLDAGAVGAKQSA